jgi:hypothetical protein
MIKRLFFEKQVVECRDRFVRDADSHVPLEEYNIPDFLCSFQWVRDLRRTRRRDLRELKNMKPLKLDLVDGKWVMTNNGYCDWVSSFGEASV